MDLEAACLVVNSGSEVFGIDTEHCMLEEHNSKLQDLLCNIQPVVSSEYILLRATATRCDSVTIPLGILEFHTSSEFYKKLPSVFLQQLRTMVASSILGFPRVGALSSPPPFLIINRLLPRSYP